MDVDGPASPERSATTAGNLGDETDTADGIYGLIVGSAVMASVHVPTVWQITVATLVTLHVYWTAEKYAHVMARRVHGPSLTWPELRGLIDRADLPEACVLLFGQEGPGLSPEAIAAASGVVEITQYGSTRSINAASAAAVIMYEWCRRWA